MIRAVLLDWGHTLFETPGSVDFITAWTARNGTPMDADEATRLWDAALRRSRTAEELAKGRDKSLEVHRIAWTALHADLDDHSPGLSAALYEFETSVGGWRPYPDTREVLEALRSRGVPAVVVSDVPFDIRPIFAHYQLDHLVHTFVLSGEHGTVKSELRLFEIALEAVGIAAGEALMVGDNNANDGAAVEAGIVTLLLPPVAAGQPRGLWSLIDIVDG